MKRFINQYWCYMLISIFFTSNIGAQDTVPNILTAEELFELAQVFHNENVDTTIHPRLSPNRVIEFNSNFSHDVVYSTSETCNECILLLVKDEIYNALSSKIVRYANDLFYALNTDVVIEKLSHENYIQVKDIITLYYNTTNLQGVLLIGDIDYVLYEQKYPKLNKNTNQYELKYASWPCDVYYMDIDGVWSDNRSTDMYQSGIFDTHTGDVEIEVVVGRIPVSYNSENIELLTTYFDKNHEYWIGKTLIQEQYALGYTDYDWATYSGYNQFTHISLLYGYDNYVERKWGDASFGNTDYQNEITSNQYEFVQLAAHSDSTYHVFTGYQYLYASTIANFTTSAIGYNLFCCSACDWRSSLTQNGKKLLAGSYLFNNGNGLSVVGSTKSGSMLNFWYFYYPLSLGNTMSYSFHEWFNDMCDFYGTDSTSLETKIHWFYGMTIIGDPFISMKYNTNTTCRDVLALNSFDTNNSSRLRYYRASERIEVGGNYVIPVGKHVIFDAPEIAFLPGFQCPVGATFETRTEGCECNHIATQQRNNAPRKIGENEDTDSNIEFTTKFQIYPNPVQNVLQITSSESIETVAIYTLGGERVLQATTTQVDVSHLTTGMHIVHATSQTGNHYTTKIVKQ